MASRIVAWVMVVVLVLGATGRAWAEDPTGQPVAPQGYEGQPQPVPPPPGQPGQPAAPMQPGQVVVVEQGGYGYGYAQPGHGQPGYGYADPREMQYRTMRKHVWLAILLDAVLPGAGNIYVGEIMYSVITWAGLVAGMTIMIQAIEETTTSDFGTSSEPDNELLGLGLMLFLGSYIFGVVTAGMNAASHNAEVRASLGLHAAITPARDFTGATLSLAAAF